MVISIAILTGGQSRRMGRDKALLPLGQGFLVQRVIDAAAPLSDELFLVSNTLEQHGIFDCPVITDLHPGLGPLGGLYTALSHSQNSRVILLACDLPYLNTPFLRLLAEHPSLLQAVIPDSTNGLQPLCARYDRRILPAVKLALDERRLGMRRFLSELDISVIPPAEWACHDPENRLFTNLNTPDDYRQTL